MSPPRTRFHLEQDSTQNKSPPRTRFHSEQDSTQNKSPPRTRFHPEQDSTQNKSPPRTRFHPEQESTQNKSPPRTRSKLCSLNSNLVSEVIHLTLTTLKPNLLIPYIHSLSAQRNGTTILTIGSPKVPSIKYRKMFEFLDSWVPF
ncbi:hypothetical protein BgiMline_006895 [Biomphalaria glabrata]